MSRRRAFLISSARTPSSSVGFQLVTLDGKESVLGAVNCKTRGGLGKYGFGLSELESFRIAAIRDAVQARRLVVIDEIGSMDIRSSIFRDALTEAFDSDIPI